MKCTSVNVVFIDQFPVCYQIHSHSAFKSSWGSVVLSTGFPLTWKTWKIPRKFLKICSLNFILDLEILVFTLVLTL